MLISPILMYQNILRKYKLRYFGVKKHYVCNLFSNDLGKIHKYTHIIFIYKHTHAEGGEEMIKSKYGNM